MLNLISQNHLGHFKYLPQALGYKIERFKGVDIINCGLGTSMFNIAFGSIEGEQQEVHGHVTAVMDLFKGQPFAWWVPPSKSNATLATVLEERGFIKECAEDAMLMDLSICDHSPLKTKLEVKKASDPQGLEDFISIIEPYDANARAFYEKLTPELMAGNEELYVGYANHEPVVIAILYTHAGTSGIFSLITKPEARNKGYGSDMMRYLLSKATAKGSQYATLSASSEAGYNIYERLGFQAMGQFDCYEYDPT